MSKSNFFRKIFAMRTLILISVIFSSTISSCQSVVEISTGNGSNMEPPETHKLEKNSSSNINKIEHVTTLEKFSTVNGIVDANNFAWPREIQSSAGKITIDSLPEKVHPLSLGHAEIIAAIMDFNKVTAVYDFYTDPSTSNIAGISSSHKQIGYDPEEVVALDPDIVIASKFTDPETVAILKDVGIPVLRAELDDSAMGNTSNILLMGYALGQEYEALSLVEEIERRVKVVATNIPPVEKLRVLSITKWATIFAAGSGSTEGGIIEQVSAINAAADSGISGHQEVSIESIAAINPDVILLPQPKTSALEFKKQLLSDPVLAEVPAIINKRIYYVTPRYNTTLSHWNVRGIEELAQLLYPEQFKDHVFEDFINHQN